MIDCDMVECPRGVPRVFIRGAKPPLPPFCESNGMSFVSGDRIVTFDNDDNQVTYQRALDGEWELTAESHHEDYRWD